MTERLERMVSSAPDYYSYSEVFKSIQGAIGAEFSNRETDGGDLLQQLFILTATWGLRYWEETLAIKIVEADGYEIRRSRVLSKWRGVGNFSAALIMAVAEAYSNGEVDVMVDTPAYTVYVVFTGNKGIPPNLEDLQAVIANIVHAHLGIEYVFVYTTWAEFDAAGKTWNDIDTAALDWDGFESWDI